MSYSIPEVIDFLELASEELDERFTVDENKQVLVTHLAIEKIKELEYLLGKAEDEISELNYVIEKGNSNA